ncbi:hypothetical protein E2C01_013192 [Portunus trituberculatus]|uniref:Uncharacterized protein n=1 Tax=Portunus trituberculatus TaxID=210409 RepID=A0A5B7DGG0_PORTR|nr:hypothetical protein [Portunus trituberculatus]
MIGRSVFVLLPTHSSPGAATMARQRSPLKRTGIVPARFNNSRSMPSLKTKNKEMPFGHEVGNTYSVGHRL